jgi:transcriptional regulator
VDGKKVDRILDIYTRLLSGKKVNLTEIAYEYGVSERSVQRDINDIRNFYDNEASSDGYENNVKYISEKKSYILENTFKASLSNSEILAICKILLQTRPFTKDEMTSLLERLIECCVPEANRKMVGELIANEAFHYAEPKHKKKFIDDMWKVAEAIATANFIEIHYKKTDETVVVRKLKFLAIMFSEHYFYLTAFIDDEDTIREKFDVLNDSFPTIYRIDRITKLKVLDKKFHIPYSSRFEEGEFLKRIQFMYGGKLRRIKFKCEKNSLEAILDRLPTANIVSEKEGKYLILAEVFGDGVDMWIRSQGDRIEIVE